jgi:RNA polymerase sigma factor (sigma-70 family)
MRGAARSQLEGCAHASHAKVSGPMLRLISPGSRARESAPTAADSRLAAPHDELAELATSVEHGDPAALRTFLATIIPHLLRVARRVLGPAHPYVEDVAHDAAYSVVQQLPQFRGEASVLNFARRVAVLTAMNVRRRDATQKRARLRDSTDPDTLCDDSADPEQQAASGAWLPVIRALLDELPEALAEAFALNVILGYTVAEIAELNRAPVETIRSRLRLAKQALKTRAQVHPALRDALEGSK